MIVKIKNHWVVKSHMTGKVMGIYKTKSEALIRLRQIKLFSKKK